MSKHAALVTLSLALLVAAPLSAQEQVIPPDPTEQPPLIDAGFLAHHQDIKYRVLGIQAYGEQRYEDAMRYFSRASFFADKPSQAMIAEMYWGGQGVPRDRALAYAWMDLAAERGYAGFLGLRERYWNSLTEAERARALEEGKHIYARFGDAAAKPRYEHQLRIGRRQMTGSRTGFNRGVRIVIPSVGGAQTIDGDDFYDARYWDPDKYWAWQDRVWMKPRIGRVSVGELQQVEEAPEPAAASSRIPEVRPDVDAAVPEVPVEDGPTPPTAGR